MTNLLLTTHALLSLLHNHIATNSMGDAALIHQFVS